MTSSAPYAELHLHTAYSFLDGASLPEELVTRAAELGYRSLAITDHDGLYGAMEFVRAAHAVGITPITGAELTLNDGSHLTLLAETPVGYVNLCRLITAAHGGFTGQRRGDPSHIPDHPIPSISLDLLSTHAEGLILLTGCRQGALARLVDAGNLPAAETLLQHYVEWFGPHSVVVELQQNLVFGDTGRIAALVALAERGGVRYAATGNVHYHRPERHPLQDVLVAIRHRTTLDGAHRQRRANAEFFLRSPREMETLFARYPAALRTTLEVAERCTSFDLVRDLAYRFPDYQTGSGETPDEHLAALCQRRLPRYYPQDYEAAVARLNEELRLIKQHGLAGFFLVYYDLLELAHEVAEEIRGVGTARAALPARLPRRGIKNGGRGVVGAPRPPAPHDPPAVHHRGAEPGGQPALGLWVDRLPRREGGRQVAPGSPGLHDPAPGIDDLAQIGAALRGGGVPHGAGGGDEGPLLITHIAGGEQAGVAFPAAPRPRA